MPDKILRAAASLIPKCGAHRPAICPRSSAAARGRGTRGTGAPGPFRYPLPPGRQCESPRRQKRTSGRWSASTVPPDRKSGMASPERNAQSGVADQKCGIVTPQHGFQVGIHLLELTASAQKLAEEHFGKHDRSARRAIRRDGSNVLQWDLAHEQNRAHRPARGDGNVRQDRQTGLGSIGDRGNDSNVGSATGKFPGTARGNSVGDFEISGNESGLQSPGLGRGRSPTSGEPYSETK